jgi:hypothetical protein
VQSSATVKVATNDLTVRNFRANATTGILQVTGPTAASTRVMTTPDANFTAARTDAAQSFTGNQTLSTGNLVQGTAGQGINFTANIPAAGMTSQLLNWYEDGTWTPNQGSGVTVVGAFSSVGSYTRTGRLVYVTGYLTGATSIACAGGNSVLTTSLPFTSAVTAVGSSVNGTASASSTLFISGTTIYMTTAIGATTNIYFTATYSV